MTKQVRFQGIDCPHCAEKIEKKVNKIKGVNKIQINFLSQKMIIDASDEDIENIINEITIIAKKIEKDFCII